MAFKTTTMVCCVKIGGALFFAHTGMALFLRPPCRFFSHTPVLPQLKPQSCPRTPNQPQQRPKNWHPNLPKSKPLFTMPNGYQDYIKEEVERVSFKRPCQRMLPKTLKPQETLQTNSATRAQKSLEVWQCRATSPVNIFKKWI